MTSEAAQKAAVVKAVKYAAAATQFRGSSSTKDALAATAVKKAAVVKAVACAAAAPTAFETATALRKL